MTINIATAINKAYLGYFSVLLTSIVKTANPKNHYRINILSEDIDPVDLHPLKPFLPENNSVEITLHNVQGLFQLFSSTQFQEGFSKEIVFRLALPIVLSDIPKLIYLDSDLLVLEDLASLDAIDFDTSIAAVRDIGMLGMVNGYDANESDRLHNLGIKNLDGYFSSGVMVWNLDKIRVEYSVDRLLSWTATHNPRYADQDCLNFFFQDDITYLDMRWNVIFDSNGVRIDEIASQAPNIYRQEYLKSREHPFIFHFAGPDKPWIKPGDGSTLFWKMARQSAEYETILKPYLTNEIIQAQTYALSTVWNTLDDVYFQLSEAERIRHDLHERVCKLEQITGDLYRQLNELRSERIPLTVRLYNKFRRHFS